MKQQKKLILPIIVLVTSLIVLVLSITYAYFAQIVDLSDTTPTDFSTGYMDITFTTNNYFSNSSMELLDASSVIANADYTEFVVAPNGGTVSTIKYDIYFNNLSVSNNLKSTYFKWALYQGDTRISEGNFGSLGTNTELKLTNSQISMTSASPSTTYRVYVWLENDSSVNQNSLLSGSFNGKVAIYATSPTP